MQRWLQVAKRLAQLALDVSRDVARLDTTLAAFATLASATAAADVEAALRGCLLEPLELSGLRVFLVEPGRRRAVAVSGTPVSVVWKDGNAGMEHAASLVAWCATAIASAAPCRAGVRHVALRCTLATNEFRLLNIRPTEPSRSSNGS
jgi:hypothetical protein